MYNEVLPISQQQTVGQDRCVVKFVVDHDVT